MSLVLRTQSAGAVFCTPVFFSLFLQNALTTTLPY